jgi:hypothetical protein
MADLNNSISKLSIGITIVFCCSYLIFILTKILRKYKFNVDHFLQKIQERIPWIKTDLHPFMEKIKKWWETSFIPGVKKSLGTIRSKDSLSGYLLEIIIIAIWGVYVGRAYLNLDPWVWPIGNEFSSSIQTHYIWTNLFKCGACVFWNGSTRGGAPAFADMQGSMLYPLVILSTLLTNVLSGVKLTLIAGLIMAGIAQWWLSKVMGFGRIPRLWSGLLAVVGGQLAARMELGTFGVLLSTAACSLVLAPGVALGLTGKRRYSILLGITIGLAFLAGQGYMQVGLIVGIIPAFLIFLPGREPKFKNLWKEYLLAGFLAFLVAGIFLIPMIHFYPNVVKNEDPKFSIAQPLKFVPLNELIDDVGFYNSTALKPAPYPVLFANFLGWVPILLAIVAWRFIPKSRLRLMLFFLAAIILVYLTASGDLLRFLLPFLHVVAGVRNPPQVAGLANPLILGLSAWGLEALLQIKWPRLALMKPNSSGPILGMNLALLILALPLILSIREAYVFGHTWLRTTKTDKILYQEVANLKTNSSEWINLPFGRHYWLIPVNELGLKISNGIRTWNWRNRKSPPVNQEASSDKVDGTLPNLINVFNGLSYLSHYENEYAYIQSGDQKVTCKAQATGGNIDVVCPESAKGKLILYENNWTGWYAWVDQTKTPLLDSDWLSTDAPAGRHTYHFRYRPWDVWVGIFLSSLGIVLSLVLWSRAKQPNLSPGSSSH